MIRCLNAIRSFGFLSLLATGCLLGWVTQPGFAQEVPASSSAGAKIFPASTDLFVQFHRPGELLEKINDHALIKKIESMEPVQEALSSPEMLPAKLGVGYLEARLGDKWLPILQKLTANGLYFGADLHRESVGIAFHASDEPLLKKTAGEILSLIGQQGGEDAYQIKEYRSGKFAEFEQGIVARFGPWFLISNNPEFAKTMADRLLDSVIGDQKSTDSLATHPPFVEALSRGTSSGDAWGFFDLNSIRESGVAEELFRGTTDNPGAELFLGGILEALPQADFLSGELTFNDESLRLTTTLPFDSNSFRDSREFFFGNRAMGRAPQPIEIPGLLGQAIAYRNLGSWWLSKEELFPENVIAQLAQSDSQLSTVFGGVDFGQEVLGALQPGLRLIVKEQTFPEEIDPSIKLPAFALVGRLQNPDDQRRFRISFQSLVGFLNINAGQMGQPQIELITTREKGIHLTGGEYYLDEEDDRGLLIYNFSPAIAFQDDYMIVSSTVDLAHELAEATKSLYDSTTQSNSNTRVTLYAETIQDQLALNRDSLIAQSMVESGKPREQAAAEIDLLLSLLDYVESGVIDFRVEKKALELDLIVRFR